MDESPGELIPPHLANMHLATPPQQLFESADRMLVQAAAIRECAKELKSQLQSLQDKVDNLEETAYQLQSQGVRDRRQLNQVFENITVLYKSILPRFKVHQPHVLSKIDLAVEEGRATIEHLEVFESKLLEFEKFIEKADNASADNDNDDDVDLGFVLPLVENNTSESPKTSAAHVAAIDLTTSGSEKSDIDGNRNSKLRVRTAVPETSDEEYDTAPTMPNTDGDHYTHDVMMNRKRKLHSNPTSEYDLDAEDKTSLPTNNKKPCKTTYGDLNQHAIRNTIYNGNETSEVNIGGMESPTGRESKKQRRKRRRGDGGNFMRGRGLKRWSSTRGA